MSDSNILSANISIEATPSGQNIPGWLHQDLVSLEPTELLILHPSERSRKATLSELSKTKSSIDTSKHLTIQRLFETLFLDFRLPNLMDEDALLQQALAMSMAEANASGGGGEEEKTAEDTAMDEDDDRLGCIRVYLRSRYSIYSSNSCSSSTVGGGVGSSIEFDYCEGDVKI